jgi:hypothetical protein
MDRRSAVATAAHVALDVQTLRSDITPTPDDLSESEMDEYDRQELKQQQERWAKVKPFEAKLCDPNHVASVLTGKFKAGKREVAALICILTQISTGLQRMINQDKGLSARAERAQDKWLLSCADALEPLMLLQRYQAKIERGIEHRLRGFRRK